MHEDDLNPYQPPNAPLEPGEPFVPDSPVEVPEQDWVLLRRFDSLIELDQIRMLFDAEDIETEVKDDHTLQADPVISFAIGGARLMVPRGDLERATVILHERFGEPDIARVEELDRVFKKNLLAILLPVVMVILVLLALGLLFETME